MPSGDLFGAVSQSYAQDRPGYPAELFDWLVAQCASRELAWDVATGSGQAAVGLSAHFHRVIATDISEAMVAHAMPRPNIEYKTMPAEQSPCASESADLVTVAQALHWFEFDQFWIEVMRSLKPGGLFAAWSYNWFAINPEIDELIDKHFLSVLRPHWHSRNAISWSGYQDIPFPLAEVETPLLALNLDWTLEQLLGYLGTWSGTRLCHEATGVDPREHLRSELNRIWGPVPRRVVMPLSMRAGRKP